MTSASFAALATVTASTKRASMTDGLKGDQTTKIASLLVTPLYPVDAELKQRLSLNTPHEIKQCFTQGDPDIVEGDTLTISGVDYPIRAVEDWGGLTDTFKAIVVEVLKI